MKIRAGQAAGMVSLVLCVLIAAGSLALLRAHQVRSDDAAATLVGALLGAAALLLGNWINWYSDRLNKGAERQETVAKLRVLIAAELVNVAAGLIGALDYMQSAIRAAQSGDTVGQHEDLSRHNPRAMPFTDGIGADLLLLDQRDIDTLTTLRSNLAVTRATMEEVTQGSRQFGWIAAKRIAAELQQDMRVLADAFELLAPTRRPDIGQAPELASALLRRLASVDAKMR